MPRPLSYPHPPSDEAQLSDSNTPLLSQRRVPQGPAPEKILRALKALAVLLSITMLVLVVRQEMMDRRDPRFATGRNGKPYLAQGRHGAVASENRVCSDIGVDVLKANGSAVDSAIATAFCIGTLNMFSSGIGGGGFLIVRNPEPCSLLHPNINEGDAAFNASSHHALPRLTHCASHVVIDFRETAPALANTTLYSGRPDSARFGGLSVGVPGEVAGLEAAHKRWGVLPWERLVEPSVKLAREARVSRELARRLSIFGPWFMFNNPDWTGFFSPDTGALLKEGQLIRRPGYARTLQTIAREGARAFYEGPIAQSLVNKIQNAGGILSLEDLASYKVEVRTPLFGRWGSRRVFTTPAPTSGGALLSILNVAGTYPNWIANGSSDTLTAHRFVEASKFAFAQRTRIGDPAFLNATALEAVAQIHTLREAARIRSLIDDDKTHDLPYYDPLFDIEEDHGTQHLSTVDVNGQAVALTSTVNLIFGSQVLDVKTGVILNDEMDDTSTPGIPNAFGLRPSPYNYPEPGKRPLSSTAPTIIEHADGSFYLSIGGSGGSRIFGAIAQVLHNLDWGMDVSQSIERPRLHHQLLPASVSIETSTDPAIIKALEEKGHVVEMVDINMAVAEVQAVLREKGPATKAWTYAASDSRKHGIAAAY